MRLKSLGRLVIMELEEYWAFPVFELVLFATMVAMLNRISTHGYRDLILYASHDVVFIFQILIVGAIVSRTFAGSIHSREVLVLLSYPVKRWGVFLSKIIANFLTIFAIFAGVGLLNIPLMGLSPLEPAVYVLIAIILVQLFFLFTVDIAISLALKNEIISIFVFILLMFGIEFFAATLGFPYRYFTLSKGSEVMFGYLTFLAHASSTPSPVTGEPPFTFQEFTVALTFPLLTSIFLLVISLIYFQWMMQLD